MSRLIHQKCQYNVTNLAVGIHQIGSVEGDGSAGISCFLHNMKTKFQRLQSSIFEAELFYVVKAYGSLRQQHRKSMWRRPYTVHLQPQNECQAQNVELNFAVVSP